MPLPHRRAISSRRSKTWTPPWRRSWTIEGVDGVMLVKDDRVGLAGHLLGLMKTV